MSEVMLQQTQASRVVPAYVAFLARFPTVADLARASRADVVRAWAGLGYHRRAVALHGSARAIVRDHGGRVPASVDALRALPGVGPYTASAVASIAFGTPVAAIDTNVRRIVARFRWAAEPDEVGVRDLADEARSLLDRVVEASDRGPGHVRPGDWNQALMDLGREVCRPRPRCEICPISAGCRFAAALPEDGRQPPAVRAGRRRQGPFEGSMRQVRGRVLAGLREREPATVDDLAHRFGLSPARIAEAVDGLARDGLVARDEAGELCLAAG